MTMLARLMVALAAALAACAANLALAAPVQQRWWEPVVSGWCTLPPGSTRSSSPLQSVLDREIRVVRF